MGRGFAVESFYTALMAPGADALPRVPERPSWHRHAACRGVDQAVFFPSRGESSAAARELCAGCAVADPCLEVALADSGLVGWWGGTSDAERKRMRRERRAAA